jgi:hypothetical protein
MMQKTERVSANDAPTEASPFIVEFFMVQGPDFRCMAYRDQNGKWRKTLNDEELTGDVYILE